MIDYRRKELSAILEELNLIEAKQERIDEFRRIVSNLPVLGLLIQYTYHPLVEYDLPTEDPREIEYSNTEYAESTGLYSKVKKLPTLWKRNQTMSSQKKYQLYIQILSTVSNDDAKLLIGVKNKRLPQRKLTERFCVEALPELFPANFLDTLKKTSKED